MRQLRVYFRGLFLERQAVILHGWDRRTTSHFCFLGCGALRDLMKALRGHFSGFQIIGDVAQLLAGVGSPGGGKPAGGLHSVGCPPRS